MCRISWTSEQYEDEDRVVPPHEGWDTPPPSDEYMMDTDDHPSHSRRMPLERIIIQVTHGLTTDVSFSDTNTTRGMLFKATIRRSNQVLSQG